MNGKIADLALLGLIVIVFGHLFWLAYCRIRGLANKPPAGAESPES